MRVDAVVAPEKGRVVIADIETEPPGAGRVAVRLAMSAISPGTERAVILAMENTKQRFPTGLGYSAVGTVVAVGGDAAGEAAAFAPGTRVACFTLPHQQVGVVSAAYAVEAPDSVDDRHAALTAIAQIALQGVRKARIEIGEAVAVFGLGPVGLAALSFARLAGAHPVIAIDREPYRLGVAESLGADVLVDTRDDTWRERVEQATGGAGPAVVIESTGFPVPVGLSFSIAARFARVILLGSTRAEASFNPYVDIHRPGLIVVGAHVMTVPEKESRPGYWTWRDDARSYLRLVAAGRITLEPLMEAPASYRDAESVYARLLEWDATMLVPFLSWQ